MTRRPVLRWLYTAGIACLFLAGMSYGWGLTLGTAAADEVSVTPELREDLLNRPRSHMPEDTPGTLTRDWLAELKGIALYEEDLPWTAYSSCTSLENVSILATSLRQDDRSHRRPRTAAEARRTAKRRMDFDAVLLTPRLRSLRLRGAALGSIAQIDQLPELVTLELIGCSADDLEAIESCTQLRHLALGERGSPSLVRNFPAPVPIHADPSMQAISSVELPPKLRYLELPGVPLPDLEAIGELSDLRILDVGGTGVRSIAPLLNLRELTVLWIDGNEIQDPELLLELPALRRLYVTPGSGTWEAKLKLRMWQNSVEVIHIAPTGTSSRVATGGTQ